MKMTVVKYTAAEIDTDEAELASIIEGCISQWLEWKLPIFHDTLSAAAEDAGKEVAKGRDFKPAYFRITFEKLEDIQ